MRSVLFTASLLLAAGSMPAWAQAMTASEIEAEIVGKTVCVESPRGEICVKHNADGSSEVVSGMPAQAGSWRFDEDQHCVTWEGAEERCTGFERVGEGYATGNGPVSVN